MASYLEYNGVRLHLSRTIRHVRDYLTSPDGSDVIGTRVTLEVEGVYAPGATSYTAEVDGDVVALPGHIAPTTDGAVRAALAMPRCTLRYVIGDVEVLQSPADGASVDVANGPIPRKWDCVKVTERAWHVRFAVETTIHGCPPTATGLLSNRWSMAESVGDDHLSTLVYEGVAVFRMDRLRQLGSNADAFRDEVLPPCPQGFRRMSVRVAVSPVGNVVQYQVVDQEQFVYLGQNEYGVVDFQGVVSQHSVPVGSGALSSVASEVVLSTFQGTARGTKGPGYRSGNLLAWLVRLAVTRLNLPVPGNDKPGGLNGNYVVTQVATQAAIDRPEASLAITVRMPPAEDANAVGALGPLRALELLADVRDSDLFNLDGIAPQMPRGANSRGHYLGQLYAQALRSCVANCSEPTVPSVIAVVSPSWSPFQAPGTVPDREEPPVLNPGSENEQLAYSEDTRSGGQISYYEARTHYETDTGVVVAGVCGDGSEPPLAFRLRNHVTRRVVQFTGERIGSKPPVPHPLSNDSREVLVGAPQISFAPPIPAADGKSKIYRVSGEFAYALVDSDRRSLLEPKGGLSMGAVPWATFEFTDPDNTLLPTDQRHGITDPRFYLS